MSRRPPNYPRAYGRLHDRNDRHFKYRFDRTAAHPAQRHDGMKPVNMYNQGRRNQRSVSAAPNPLMPSSQTVQKLINSCIDEIRDQQYEENSLCRRRAALDTEEHVSNESFVDSLGIVEFRGTLVCHPLIDELKKQNQQKICRSKAKALIPVQKGQTNVPTFYHNIGLGIDHDFGVLPSMFVCVYWRKQVVLEKCFALLKQYRELASLWSECCVAIDCFNIIHHDDENFAAWGLEQPYHPTKPYGGRALRVGCACDVPMYLDSVDKLAYCFRDDNKSVEDPVYEHKVFRKRLSWTTEEQNIFVEKWALHPKKFRQIAHYLPQKTVKDCIEFYYLIKNNMHLASKKRAGKKVVTEGKVEN